MTEYAGTPRLELDCALGFSGRVPNGLIAHPDGTHIIHPLGACIVIREIGKSFSSDFLYGHNDKISCLAVSPSGRYVASGQVTHPGFQADVCIFDFAERRLVHRMLLHKVKVQALSFSSDERTLASVGGPEDNTVVLWDVETGRPFCGAPAHHTETKCVAFLNHDLLKIMTGGVGSLRVWSVDMENRKMNPVDINLGNLRRSVTTLAIEQTDKYAYCGTTTGDVLCVQLGNAGVLKMKGPLNKCSGGIVSLIFNRDGHVLVGSGSGEVRLLSKINLTVLFEASVKGGVTGLALVGPHYFVGTDASNMYFINGGNFRTELRVTCHSGCINDLVFPAGFSLVFATCGGSDIRLWNAKSCTELLRIEIPGLTCNCIHFTADGSMIISGWSDGRLRGFGPQSGKLIFTMHDAHKSESLGQRVKIGGRVGVTSVCNDHTSTNVITGGSDGQVRVWRITGKSCFLKASMKEHKSTVNALAITHDDTECVSASDDGSCIVWDLTRFVRRNIIYLQTYFRAVAYYPDESQIITCGNDKSITYWDSVDCNAIRELSGSKTGELNTLSMSPNGDFFATGGNDRILKVWNYERGDCIAVGVAHSCSITKVVVSPDGKRIVSVGDEGAIFLWNVQDLVIDKL
ncbi:unnamed protein product [Phytomonas sp. EM1]|nr:unnamed protein product [Phytomonas sp. EM1]|eukprot:CCW62363.1 unnamed protein product [Phytomonas sp. isolate EM1]